MNWTHDKPTKPGWYWYYWYYCSCESAEPVAAWVVTDLDTGALVAFFAGQEEAEDLADLNTTAWWAGPIRPPDTAARYGHPGATTMTRTEAVEWQERLFPAVVFAGRRPTLPEICLDLRASVNGEADPWPDEFLAEVVLMLQARLDTWGESHDVIDDHVRGMVQQAVWLGRAAEAERLTEQRTGGTS